MSIAARWITGCAVLLCALQSACTPLNNQPCPEVNETAEVSVFGVYRYFGGGMNELSGMSFRLSGTITFVSEEGLVRVTDTTYDFAGLRRLQSEPAAMQGNRLRLLLTPQNGDEDYRADVEFVFSEDGSRFCVGFSDTNNDMGGLGSFAGNRVD